MRTLDVLWTLTEGQADRKESKRTVADLVGVNANHPGTADLVLIFIMTRGVGIAEGTSGA